MLGSCCACAKEAPAHSAVTRTARSALPVELGMDRYNHRNATKNERSTGGRSGTAQPFPLWRLPQRPVCDAHQSKYSETVFRSCPPGPNTWTLNIQPLGQFRPHRGFLLARFTLLTSVARLLHTAGCLLLRRFVDA